jgi:adenine-specific DNA methylase
LGCDAFASDVNPVACLILEVMLEDIPRHGLRLADELRKAGTDIKAKAEKELAEFYPPDPDGARPIAYLWARTVRCEAPACGAQIPLVRSFWLARKTGRKRALKYLIARNHDTTPRMKFEIFSPSRDGDAISGTISNGRAKCPACDSVLPPARIRAQLSAQKGGANNARLLAVVLTDADSRGRTYRLPTDRDAQHLERATTILATRLSQHQYEDISEPISPMRPSPNARGVSAPTRYGITEFRGLFTDRQRLSLMTFTRLISEAPVSPEVRRLLGLALDKVALQCNAHCRWKPTGESLVDVFGRHAIPMVWDFAEATPLGETTGGWNPAIDWICSAVEGMAETRMRIGQVSCASADEHPLPDESTQVWFTDPPYYDNIPYSDLSDFFYVWLRRSLASDSMIRNNKGRLTPKSKEIVWNQAHQVNGQPKGPDFFEMGIARAASEGKRILARNGAGCIVFAHKTTEGWEALLTGIVAAGWIISASWPIDTEMATRVSARNTASLATSVHLIVRPRPKDAPVGEWAEVLRELPVRVGNRMERLHNEGIRGADMVFACIGPALEIYSRHSRVETAGGREIELPEYLGKVWEVVGRKALENVLGTAESRARNGAAGTLEEDARLTALFLWTLQSNATKDEEAEDGSDYRDDEEEDEVGSTKGGYSLVFDVARRFSQPLGIDLPKWEGRIIKTEKGVVRLLSIHDRTKQLFGEEGALAMADHIEEKQRGPVQMKLFADAGRILETRNAGKGNKTKTSVSNEALKAKHEATTLDRVHAAMLLQDSGRTNALRALIEAEQQRGPEFMRLANALSALYPPKSEEKRLLDAMILSAPR